MTVAVEERARRAAERLKDLPFLALPTDYPRPPVNRLVEASIAADVPEPAARALLKLALFTDETDDDQQPPSAFHCLFAAFVVLLHRYTGDTDLLVASSSLASRDPLLLRIPVEPTDPFWAILRRVQLVERDAESTAVDFDSVLAALGRDADSQAPNSRPLFRVRFFDQTDESSQQRFIHSTSLTSDLTFFVTCQAAASSRQSLAPALTIRASYNALLFTSARISFMLQQLSVFLVQVSKNPLLPVGLVPLLTQSQKMALPDPTADLHWCDWKGAIPDIFTKNALQWPDRPCVVQNLPSEVPGSENITFTYSIIRRAANVVAHHLLDGGIQREDVVMVYAYRSVELVIAVMGILKAGATFSVIGMSSVSCSKDIVSMQIDPAYPPSRQTIYLQVARPRGLIILKGAGQIHDSVADYVQQELDICVQIPALEIHPDGTVFARVDLKDTLAVSKEKANIDPQVPLGPDSVGTLSFTSGSTGIPKGVRGRHYSLTHFFPWMGERFGLGERSKFTMLSGIAHDPIQRDSKHFYLCQIISQRLF